MKFRKCLEKVSPYSPGKTEEEIKKLYNLEKVVKLASNENPYGPSPKVIEALKNIDSVNLYPDNFVTDLREKLTNELNIEKDEIIFGNGSVEIIQMLSRIMLDMGDNIIVEDPSFSSYFSEAMIQDANIKTIDYNEDYSFNLSDMLDLIDEKTKMIIITNPNNPLGTAIDLEEIDHLMSKIKEDILVVIDEAYFEFVRKNNFKSAISITKKYKNIAVLRTFSKAYGMAALRIGYCVANKDVITELEKVRVPFNASTISQSLACIALDDKKYMLNSVQKIHKTIDYMYEALETIGLEYIKTDANFIMINVKEDSHKITFELLKKGFIVRDAFPRMDTWIRVTIGTQEQMEEFVQALKEVI